MCVRGEINFRMRNFGRKLKILNVKLNWNWPHSGEQLYWALFWEPVSLWHQRGAHCAIVSAGQVFALSAAWTANNAPRRRTLATAACSRQQGRGRRQEAPCKRLVNVVACRLFNCGPSVTHSHSHSLITSSSSGKFYLNKLWYMEISGDCWMAMGVGMGSRCGCESRRRMTETIPKR